MPLLMVLVTTVAGIAAVTAWLSWSRQLEQLEERQAQVVRVLEEANFPLSATVLRQMARLSGQEFVVWHRREKRIVETSFAAPPTALRDRLEAALTPTIQAAEHSLVLAGESYFLREIGLTQPPGHEVIVLTSQRSLNAARWDAVWPPFAIGGGAFLLLVPWLLSLTRGWSRRIQGIQRDVAVIANGGALTRSQPPDHDDELMALLADIRRMERRLWDLQAELVRSERERLVAQWAAGFAHQLRNGLAGASLALELHATRCGAAQEPSLNVARKQLRLLETEIRGMLSLARRERGPRAVVSIAALLQETVELLLPTMEHRRIDLEVEPIDPMLVIDGVRDGLRAAVLNLLLNAIDAAGPGGVIRLCAGRQDDGVSIEVRDNGAGPADAARMLEPFFTTKPEGLGLGLTIVGAVTEDHGGRFGWRREEPWTLVELWLPCRRAAGAMDPDESRVGGG